MADYLDPVVLRFGTDAAALLSTVTQIIDRLEALGEAIDAVTASASAAFDRMSAAGVETGSVIEEMAAASSEAIAAVEESALAGAEGMQVMADEAAAAAPLFDNLAAAETAAADAERMVADAAAMAAPTAEELAAALDALTVAADEAAAANERLGVAIKTSNDAYTFNAAASKLAAAQSRDAWSSAYDTVSGALGGLLDAAQTALKWSLEAGAAIAAVSLDLAAKFDQGMELIHTQAGASQAEVDALTPKVLDVAAATGTVPEKAAEALYHIESLGYRGQEAMDILTASLKESRIGMSDVESTATALGAIMRANLTDVKNAADATAYMNAIVGAGNMKMQDLVNALGTGALSTFKEAGLGITDFGAALATLTDNAVPADEAATRLRMTISLMEKPSGPATDAMKKIGLASDQLAKDLVKPDGLMVAVQDLHTKLAAAFGADAVDGVNHYADILKTKGSAAAEDYAKRVAEANNAVDAIFGGAKSGGTMMTLIGQVGTLGQKYQAMGTEASRAAAQQDAWNAQQKQFSQQIDEIKTKLEVFGIKLGNAIMPFVESVMNKLPGVFHWLEDQFNKIGAALKSSGLFVDLQQIWDKFSGPAGDNIKKSLEGVVKAITDHKAEIREAVELMVTGFMWLAKNVLPLVIDGIGGIVRGASDLVDAWNWAMNVVLTIFGNMLKSADEAFGWIPGIGPKLDNAVKQFDQFQANVNANLDKIKHDIPLNIDVKLNSPIAAPVIAGAFSVGSHKMYADGGWVTGGAPGDPIPAIVHAGEFVLSRDMIAAMRSGNGPATLPMPSGGIGGTFGTGGGGGYVPIVINLGGTQMAALLAGLIPVAQRQKVRTGTTGLA